MAETVSPKYTLAPITLTPCRWLKELGKELEERVTQDRSVNGREPTHLSAHAAPSWGGQQISRSGPLRKASADVIAEDSLMLVPPFLPSPLFSISPHLGSMKMAPAVTLVEDTLTDPGAQPAIPFPLVLDPACPSSEFLGGAVELQHISFLRHL